MKNKQRGFASLYVLFTVVVIIGIGIYFYKQHSTTQNNVESIQIKNSIPETHIATNTVTTKNQAIVNLTKPAVASSSDTPDTVLLKSYNDTYSFRHPAGWKFGVAGTDQYCLPNSDGCITVTSNLPEPLLGDDYGLNKPISDSMPKVTIGKNTFSTSKGVDFELYILPAGKMFGKYLHIEVTVTNPNMFKRSDINLVLSSLKVGPFIGSITTGVNQEMINDGQVKLDISAFRRYVSPATDDYTNVCNTVSQENNFNFFEVKYVLEEAKKIMGDNMYCRSSKDHYVFYARLSTGMYVCTDEVKYFTSLKTKPKAFSCN